MLAWTVAHVPDTRACSRRAYPPNRHRLSLPLLEGLPSWIPWTSPMGCCDAGRLVFGVGLVRGNCLLVSLPIQASWQHAWCLACEDSGPSGGSVP